MKIDLKTKSSFRKESIAARRLLAIVDVEATSSEATARHRPSHDEFEIIEFGCVVLDSTTLRQIAMMQSFIKPSLPPTEFITDLTGITESDLENAPSPMMFADMLQGWLQPFSASRLVFCSWGPFDWLLLQRTYQRMKRPANELGILFDGVVNLAREFKTKYGNIKGNRSAARMLGIDDGAPIHRALDDALNIANVVRVMAKDRVDEKQKPAKQKQTSG